MFSHVEAIDEHNLDEVLQSLKNIKDEIENMIKVDELHKHVGLVGISVAMESSKLWHSTKYDNMHPLHEMINYFDPETGNRRLQINFLPFKVEFDTAAVVLADVRAAVFNALNSFGGTGGEGGVGSSLTDVVFKATAASAASFANTVSLEQKEDDDDYTYYAPTGNIEPQQPNDNTQQPQQPNDNTQQPQQPNDGDSPSDDIFKEFDDFICGLIGCDPTDEVNEEP